MADYIERGKAIAAFYSSSSDIDGKGTVENLYPVCGFSIEKIEKILGSIKAGNVREDVQGKWIPFKSTHAGDIWYCSACDIGFSEPMDFCPHCGARMCISEGD